MTFFRRYAIPLNLLVIAVTMVFVGASLVVGRAAAAPPVEVAAGLPSPVHTAPPGSSGSTTSLSCTTKVNDTWPPIEQDTSKWAELIRRETSAHPEVLGVGESYELTHH